MRSALISVPAALLLLLGGCAETDPYRKTGQWQPTGANALNLAAMVVNPQDLIRGRGAPGALGKEATPAVERLYSGKTVALPAIGSQDTAPGPAAAPGAAPGATN